MRSGNNKLSSSWVLLKKEKIASIASAANKFRQRRRDELNLRGRRGNVNYRGEARMDGNSSNININNNNNSEKSGIRYK